MVVVDEHVGAKNIPDTNLSYSLFLSERRWAVKYCCPVA